MASFLSKMKIWAAMAAACALSGCFYIQNPTSARVVKPGQIGYNTHMQYNTFSVDQDYEYYDPTPDPGEKQLTTGKHDYGYDQAMLGSYGLRIGMPSNWDFGLGFDLWSGLNLIGSIKYQWLPQVEANDFCSALELELYTPSFRTVGLACTLAFTKPFGEPTADSMAGMWDLNFGARAGVFNDVRPFYPASAMDSGQFGPVYPEPGDYRYFDLYLGVIKWAPSGNTHFFRSVRSNGASLGLTVRFPFLAENKYYYEYDFDPGAWSRSEDFYQPMVSFSLGLVGM